MTLNKIIEMEQSTARRYLDKTDKVEKFEDKDIATEYYKAYEDKDVYMALAKYHIKIAEYLTELKMIKDRNGRE